MEGLRTAATIADALSGHLLDWLRACEGGDPPCSHFGISGPFAEWMLLGVMAFRRRASWNGTANLHFTNSAEANKYVKYNRQGWELRL
jgi:hypothetical protein